MTRRHRTAAAFVLLNAVFVAWLAIGTGVVADLVVALWVVALILFTVVFLALRQKHHRVLREEDVRRAESSMTTFKDDEIDHAVDKTRIPPPAYLDL